MPQRLPKPTTESKQDSESTLPDEFDNYAVSRAVMQSVWPDATRKGGVFTVKDVELICGLGERTAYRKVNMDSDWTLSEILALMAASVKRGGSPLLDLVTNGAPILSNDCGAINHSLDDETREIVELQGQISQAYRKGDKAKATKLHAELGRVFTREGKEIKAAR